MERMSAEIEDLRKKNDDLTKDYKKLCDMHSETQTQLATLIMKIATEAGVLPVEPDVLPVDSDEDEPKESLIEDLEKAKAAKDFLVEALEEHAKDTCDAINSMRLELKSFDAEMAASEPQDD